MNERDNVLLFLIFLIGLKMRIFLFMGIVLAANIRLNRCQNHTAGSVSDGTLVCFSCRGMTHLKYCNVVERCTENLGCFVEQFFIGSQPRYNSGCMTPDLGDWQYTALSCTQLVRIAFGNGTTYHDSEIFFSQNIGDADPSIYCNAIHVTDAVAYGTEIYIEEDSIIRMTCDIILHQQRGICATCCNTSLCNSHGCGDSGFGNQVTRGPLCYECEYLGNPAECVTIQQCLSGQVCHIAEFQWGDTDYLYSMGCNSKSVCTSPISSLWTPDHAIIGRSAPTCSRCCEQDFCNLYCAVPLHGQTTATTAALLKLTTYVTTTTPPTTRFLKTRSTPAQPSITLLPLHSFSKFTTHITTTMPHTIMYMTKHLTTRQAPITLPPVQRTCYTCGTYPFDICDIVSEETQCNPPNNYCMNIVNNSISGTRTVERKCVSFHECYTKWWQGSSDEGLCQTYTPDNSVKADFQCSFCCIEDRCNHDIKPPKATLFQAS